MKSEAAAGADDESCSVGSVVMKEPVHSIRCRGPRPERALVVEPVRELDEEDVLRRHAEDAVKVASEIEAARNREIRSRLLPHDKQRRARLVLPTKHVGSADR